jgi:hypothetical protein
LDLLWYAVLLFGAIVGLWAVYSRWKNDRERSESLWSCALGSGMNFNVIDVFGIDSRPDFREAFPTGHNRLVSNITSTIVDGWQVKAFDFTYETGSGKSRQVFNLSVIMFDTALVCPTLTIRPETLLDKVAGAVGFADIDFESEEFSRKFCVRSDDKKFAYDIIHPKVMQFLLAHPRWRIRLGMNSLIIHEESLLSPQESQAGIAFGREFLNLIPEFVKQQYGAPNRTTPS